MVNTYRILTGDAIEQLRTLPDASVHCVVTSPPYWGLRDYGTATWEGGDPECDHKVGRFTTPASDKQRSNNGSGDMQAADTCPKCGAIRIDQQIGLEQTPAEYVARLVDVFREVRRILRPDGVVFLNLGDSYNGSGGAGGDYGTGGLREGQPKYNGRNVNTLKPKDLVGIPWRVAFALQDDGWWLRSDIIWAKPNPMPESVMDRPTKAHEYIFLLTKRARYYFDADAVRENSVDPKGSAKRYAAPFFVGDKHESGGYSANGQKHTPGMKAFDGGRNIRTVWDIATQPYSGAHFATMPTEIPRRCIRAGTSERGCCPACGAPWRRVVERVTAGMDSKTSTLSLSGNGSKEWAERGAQSTTTGWQPTCDCNAGEPVPCTVLDPFGGSGTTAAVAIEQGRDAVICELNPAYVELARRRIQDVAPLLSVEATV